MQDVPNLPTHVYHLGDNGGFTIYAGKIPARDLIFLFFSTRPDIDRLRAACQSIDPCCSIGEEGLIGIICVDRDGSVPRRVIGQDVTAGEVSLCVVPGDFGGGAGTVSDQDRVRQGKCVFQRRGTEKVEPAPFAGTVGGDRRADRRKPAVPEIDTSAVGDTPGNAVSGDQDIFGGDRAGTVDSSAAGAIGRLGAVFGDPAVQKTDRSAVENPPADVRGTVPGDREV